MKLERSKENELVFKRITAEAQGFHLSICEQDFDRPWGGFLRFDESSLSQFLESYWEDQDIGGTVGQRSPKVLLVAPGQRLSLQYHKRRSELWRVIDGPVLVILGADIANLEWHVFHTGEVVRIPCGYMHRLAAPLTSWGRVAEIWEHVDPSNPSTEDDVIRVQDDYKRD